MAKRSHTIELEVPPDRAEQACRRAVDELGWDLVGPDPGATLAVREDITKLSCKASPARIDLELRPESGGGTTLVMGGSVPGPRWVGTEHLRSRMYALGRRVLDASR